MPIFENAGGGLYLSQQSVTIYDLLLSPSKPLGRFQLNLLSLDLVVSCFNLHLVDTPPIHLLSEATGSG